MADSTIERHPDIAALRMRYEQANESPLVQIAESLGVMGGVYLAISPWVVGFSDLPTITVNNLVTGIAVAILALGFASNFGRTHGLVWVAPPIGAWTIITPWVVSGEVDTTTVVVHNVIVGAVLVLLGVAALLVGMRRTRH
jgi:hypothetical protein